MDSSTVAIINTLAVTNADKRLKERPNTICAWADYDAGLIQGFKDGAEWALLERLTVEEILNLLDNEVVVDYIQGLLDRHRGAKRAMELQDTWKSVAASEQANIQEVLKAENKVLKRQIEWMQATIDKLHMENIERDFGKRGDGIKDLKKGIKAFLMANGRYAGSSETAQILREIADEWDD